MKKYVVTITEIGEVSTIAQGPYTVIDKRPWKRDELSDAAMFQDEQAFLKDNPLKEIKGYAPDRETTKTVETELLRQTVETLDLAAVIKAVNGL